MPEYKVGNNANIANFVFCENPECVSKSVKTLGYLMCRNVNGIYPTLSAQ